MPYKDKKPQHTIQTDYYDGKKLVRSNHAKHPNSAVCLAVKHMQTRRYSATTCEVFDTSSGELHAVLKMPIAKDEILILYKREVKADK